MKASRRNLPLNSLRVFESVGKHQHLGKAGKELGITASAVSQQIKKLEDLLECDLLERDKTGTRLTTQGIRLLGSITRSLDRLTYATQYLKSSSDHIILNIACYSGFYKHWLAPRLPDFLERYPNFDIILQRLEENWYEIPDDVDLAIIGSSLPPGRDSLKLRQTLKINVEHVPACTPEYLSKSSPINTPRDLLQHCLIHFDAGEFWGDWLSAAGINPNTSQKNIYLTGCYERAYDAIANHLGIGFVNKCWFTEEFESGEMIIPIEASFPSLYTYFLQASEASWKSPATEEFIDWLYEQQE